MRHLFPCLAIIMAAAVQPAAATAQAPPCPRCPPLGILFVINGCGNDFSVSESVDLIRAYRKLPLQAQTIPWCRYTKVAHDVQDVEARMAAAKNLIVQIHAFRSQCPEGKIYLIGHSAGCHVALLAAGGLPPDTLDRIVLLAPAVSRTYDLRPALRATRCGIATFFSKQDEIVSLGAEMFCNADGGCAPAAGETGFIPPPCVGPDSALYSKLRQFYWHPDLVRTGNLGGHYGFTRAGFLDACVLPLMLNGP